MGKNVTKKKKAAQRRRRRTLRAGVMGLLVLMGVGTMAGMAMFNASVKPNRDMQWYVRQGAVEVAAPALGEGYAQTAANGARTGAIQSRGQAAPEVVADEDALSLGVIDRRTAEVPTVEPTREPVATEAPVATPEPTPEPTEDPSGSVTLTISAAGDCTFGGEEGAKGQRRFTQYARKYGYEYFFQNVRSIFEGDDLTIVNLEGPLTTSDKPGKHGGFIFKGDPDYVNILTSSSVELCNLANNHTLDYGRTGLKETASILSSNGVGYCGYTQAWYSEMKGVRVCALGFDQWNNTKDEIAAAVAEARPNCDLLIVSMHWGEESRNDYNSKQEAMGHAIVDAGADLVIGTHPHVYQGIEKYKGKYIVYSLGNFCFAGNANPNDKRCLIFQQTFSFNPGMGIAQANILDQGINLIPCTVSSVKDMNDFQPTVMAAKEGGSLLKNVVRRSTNFVAEKVRWMKNNYLLATGLVKTEEEREANAVLADIKPEEIEADIELEETPEAEDGSVT